MLALVRLSPSIRFQLSLTPGQSRAWNADRHRTTLFLLEVCYFFPFNDASFKTQIGISAYSFDTGHVLHPSTEVPTPTSPRLKLQVPIRYQFMLRLRFRSMLDSESESESDSDSASDSASVWDGQPPLWRRQVRFLNQLCIRYICTVSKTA